ncbi:YihY/virulence factor BrkB family protein [Microbacterium sp. BG28]|uniref:YihY/virulence factor BrkB family protein n=1 Tax=Microbacterium sp. BG28 TaxID=3097356 RepID=UPI002A5A8923|nr:YihY/virulence factor BrkB family protein [Microbacterium sp. BG28]MDY0830302.1 YihY/virulence factor BrkB family protein [Microbacterium sp. BG28]
MRRARENDADMRFVLPEDESSLRDRWDSAQANLRERLDEPIEKATALTRRTLSWFPIRVWRHFLQHNGFLLAAGVSYQSLFAIFAGIYLAAAAVGLWLGGDDAAVHQLIDIVNSYIPALISESGLVKPSQVEAVASQSSGGLLPATGAIALVVVIWTAIGFITYTRRAVRDTFGLPFDSRSYLMLKARDLLAAALFGIALLAGWVLVQITTWALDLLASILQWQPDSTWSTILARALSLVVAFLVNAVALALLFRFLTGTSLRWRRIWPGSILGGAALALLQVGAGLLLRYTPSNPLIATFAIFIGFLLWFRITGIVILVAAAWIAVSTSDRDLPLVELSDAEREALEVHALSVAAQVRLREARERARRAAWWQRPAARRRVQRAAEERDAAAAAAAALTTRPRFRHFLD